MREYLRGRRAVAVLATSVLSVSVAVGTASAVAPTKKKPQQSVSGSLKWTIADTLNRPGDPALPNNTTEQETVTRSGTLKIDASRDPKFTRTYVFKRTKAPYTWSFERNRVTKEWSFFDFSCEITTAGNAAGSGATDASVQLIGRWNGNKDISGIDKRTKGISVYAQLPSAGSETTTYKGSGLSPCGDITYTDPLDEAGSTSANNSANVCLPKGMARPNSSYQPLFGKWNNAKKRFDFGCSKTFTDGDTTQTITVSGSLKYKR